MFNIFIKKMGGKREQEITSGKFIGIFLCGICATILLITAVTSTHWFRTPGHRQGLFSQCIEDLNVTLPWYLKDSVCIGCESIRQASYIQAVAACSISAILTVAVVTFLTGVGLWNKNLTLKIRYYTLAANALALPLLLVSTALILYPVCFVSELSIFTIVDGKISWEAGWGYGLFCGAEVFLIACLILFM